MRTRTTGILLLPVPLLAGVSVLLARNTPAIYMQVDELAAERTTLVGQRVAVHGIVTSPRSVDSEWRFQLTGRSSAIGVDYRGMVPSTFGDRAEVVVKGRVTPDDGLAADSVLVRIPD